MKGIFCFWIVLLSVQMGNSQDQVLIIPQPRQISVIGEPISVLSAIDIEIDPEFMYLENQLKQYFKDWNSLSERQTDGYFTLRFLKDKTVSTNEEAYSLSVTDSGVIVSALSEKGAFYGFQTLKQLIDFRKDTIQVMKVDVFDQPRFSWRSYMLDEGRYFFGKEFVIKMLDELAELKINKFHWHLTEDAGWRIEIKKYPKLTSEAAYRKDTQIGGWSSDKYSGVPHGGFYTQDEIREIIEYAKSLHIDIIPEIEMPGHASAAIVAYPWLGVIGKIKEVPVRFGKHDDSFNIAKEEVQVFLKDVLDEVIALFPYEVIHIGGDEVLFEAWSASDDIRQYILQHDLAGPAEAQIRFTNEIANYLQRKGRRMMGWNEILGANVHGFDDSNYKLSGEGLSKEAIVHFWRGELDLLSSALEKGYQIVNSLHSETYLDYDYKNLPLSRYYQFEPIPFGLAEGLHHLVLGVGTQMWTEWTPDYQHVEYQTFPRIAAFSEVAWSVEKDYDSFLKRVRWRNLYHWKPKGIMVAETEIL
jgi:hexosaminidase